MDTLQGSPSQVNLTHTDLKLNFEASFNENVQKFRIAVHENFLVTSKLKASLTRFVDDIDQPDFTDGPPRRVVEEVADYWSKEYDWRKVEAKINDVFEQYTTIVRTSNSGFPHPVPLHFVHHRSSREDAIPLLFIHGWPGSFLEVENLLEPLTNPASEDLPAFHVVAPSIPGYGFSPSPGKPGMGYRATAHAFHALMQKLGYSRYVYQGGDAGDFIGHFAALDFPDAVVSGHSNFWISPPSPSDLARYDAGKVTEDEKRIIEQLAQFSDEHWAYAVVHQTRPLKLAIGLTDSPVGLAMWIYEVFSSVEPGVFTTERVITWTMMHWINGPYAAFSLYKYGRQDGVISVRGINAMPYVSQPIAVSQFPKDIGYGTPLEWAKRTGNVVYFARHDRGGHFAATDAPDLLIEDVRKFFGDKQLSGTRVFHENHLGS
ncbi:putative Alpha/Beta hydrolase protein [Seiridium cardinale]